jgi:RHS repeat-associated protein
MKLNQILVFILFLMPFSSTMAQEEHPIIKRIIQKDPGVLIYTQKNPEKFTIAAAVDKQTHVSYMVSRYGTIVDSAHIENGDYQLLESKKVTAFDHYNIFCNTMLSIINTAKKQIRQTGGIDSQWEFRTLVSTYMLEKTNIDAQQKIERLDMYRGRFLIKRWLLKNLNPENPSVPPKVENAEAKLDNDGFPLGIDSTMIAYATYLTYKDVRINTQLFSSLGLPYTEYEVSGNRTYELTDHRGNVMAEISDKRIQHSSDDIKLDDYQADVVSARDYYTFGSGMPARSFGSSGRFGFNGKEDDKESAWQDYGMRMYDGRLGRFLSVDPITGNYPELSSFQFASNSPISGIDLDGLEYIHYNVFLNKNQIFIKRSISEDFRNMSSSQVKKIHGIYSDVFYKTFSQSFGPEGRGIKYTYYKENDIGTFSQIGKPQWEVRQNSFGSQLTRHGIFYGAGSITKAGPMFGKGFGKYDLDNSPIDMPDAIAREHDREENTPNYTSWTDPVNIFADIRFVNRLKLFRSKVQSGSLKADPFTGRGISDEAYKASGMAIDLFSTEISRKKLDVNDQFRRGDISAKEYGTWQQKVKDAEKEKVILPTHK